MVAFTPLGLPYPEVTDRVADGWDAIRDLAVATDAALVLRATDAELSSEATARANGDNALDARLDALEAAGADTGWLAPALATGWVNYAGGFAAAGYRKIAGIVYLRGLVKASGIPEHAVHVFTLPAGYRPGSIQVFVGAATLYTPDVGSVGVRIDITSGGLVQPTLEATDPGGAVPYLSLSGISFPADA